MAQKKLIILGAGPAGYVGAIRAGRLGMDVTVVEKAELGGTCLNWGCIPSKALLHSARIASEARLLFPETGSLVGSAASEWDGIRRRKEEAIDALKGGVGSLLKGAKVNVVKGEGRLLSSKEVLAGTGKGKETIKGDAILVATGSEALRPGPFAVKDPRIMTSTEALAMKMKPSSVVVVGAGAVGIEFSRFYAAFGIKVTLVEMMDQCIPGADKEIAKIVQSSLKSCGIECLLNTKVAELKPTKRAVKVSLGDGSTINADQVLVAIGRATNVRDIGLEEAGVKLDASSRFVQVSPSMETSCSGVYAAGDITGGYLLAHKASAEAIAAVSYLSEKGRPIQYNLIPACIYGEPEVASVGATEEMLKERKTPYVTGKFHYSHLGRGWAEGKKEGLFKVMADPDTGEILGVHIVGETAPEIIHEACVAMRLEATAEELMAVIHAHPSFAEGLWEAAAGAFGQGIHG